MTTIPRAAIMIVLVVLIGGCGGKPLLSYSLATPPLITLPISHSAIIDGRGRFREIYCAVQTDHGDRFPNDRPCEDVLHTLMNEPAPTGVPVYLGKSRLPLHVVVVPGLFNDCISHKTSAFRYARAHLESLGYKTSLLLVSGRSSGAYNAEQIRNWLLETDFAPEEKLVMLGYSKGATDILEALCAYPEHGERVAAVVSVAGVVGGTALADGLGHLYSDFLKELDIEACPPGDGGAVEDLKRSVRQEWLARNQLPDSIPYFSIGGFAPEEEISSVLQPFYSRLAQVDPRNDSQVIFSDIMIPGSALLGYVKADHWAIAMPFSRDMPWMSAAFIDHNPFPREILLESIIRFVEESLLAAQ